MVRPRTGFDAVVLGDGTVLAVGDDQACLPGSGRAGQRDGRALRPDRGHLGRGPEPEQAPQGTGHGRHVGRLRDGARRSQRRRAALLEHEAVRDRDRDLDGRSADGARAGPAAGGDPARRQGASSSATPGRRARTRSRASSSIRPTGRGSRRPRSRAQTWIDADGGPRRRDGPRGRHVSKATRSRRRSPIVYDPAEDVWGGVQGLTRLGFELVALPDGRALAIGGNDGGELSGGTGAMTADVHRFEPVRGVWVPVSPMSTARSDPQVAVLEDGRVLVAGGGSAVSPTVPRR